QCTIFDNFCSSQEHDTPDPEAKLFQCGKVCWLHIESIKASLCKIYLPLTDTRRVSEDFNLSSPVSFPLDDTTKNIRQGSRGLGHNCLPIAGFHWILR